jgi:hypothetical protein
MCACAQIEIRSRSKVASRIDLVLRLELTKEPS